MVIADDSVATDDTDNKNQASQPSLSGEAASGGGPAPGAQAGGSPASGGGKPASSGQFTNLQKYLDANKDFGSDRQGMADQFSQNIQNQADSVEGNLSNVRNQFDEQAQAGTSSYANSKGLVDRAIADPTGFVAAPDNTQDASHGPSAQSQVDQFHNALNASYTGPSGLDQNSYQNLLGDVQNLNDTAHNAQTESGRYNLLQNMFGGSSYGYGQQKLDNLFLQNDPNLHTAVNQATGAATSVGKDVTDANALATAQAGQNVQKAADMRDYVHNALGLNADGTVNTSGSGALPTIMNTVNGQVTANTDKASHLVSDITNHTMTSADWGILGLDPTNFGQLYGVDPTKVVQPITANAANSATADQYATYEALAQLAGTTPTFLHGSAPGANNTFDGLLTGEGTQLGSAVSTNRSLAQSEIPHLYSLLQAAEPVNSTLSAWQAGLNLAPYLHMAPDPQTAFANMLLGANQQTPMPNGQTDLQNFLAAINSPGMLGNFTDGSPNSVLGQAMNDFISSYGITNPGLSNTNDGQTYVAQAYHGAGVPTTAQGGMITHVPR